MGVRFSPRLPRNVPVTGDQPVSKTGMAGESLGVQLFNIPPSGYKGNMLGLGDLSRILEDVSYRPGWSFSLYEDKYEGIHIRILAELQNSYNMSTDTVIGVNSPLPPFRTEQDFLEWLGWRLRRIESHESREFFKYQGVCVSDPHKEGGAIITGGIRVA